MIKTLYLDCSNGISGNSLLGALFDSGLSFIDFKQQMHRFLKNDVFEFSYEQVSEFKIDATFFDVVVKNEDESHRNIEDIENLIKQSHFSKHVQDNAVAIFHKLAEALAFAHQIDLQEVIFQERKAIDTLIDIVGVCWGFEKLGIQQCLSSPLHVGSGSISYRYGELAIPAPATKYIIQDMPFYQNDIVGELVTPTGAAIIKHFVSAFAKMPKMKDCIVGYGVPVLSMHYPGYLTLFIGHRSEAN